jgi:hypothetical protein
VGLPRGHGRLLAAGLLEGLTPWLPPTSSTANSSPRSRRC